MQREFVESMKTIAQSAVERAGFDKTRNGKIVGVNSITNTYSVKVDGIVYNNVKTVNDITCNKGDTVKVNIPMNNPSQAYITSSVLSDDSIGSKLAVVDEAIDQIDNKIDGIVEIMNSIYQLSISVAYDNDPNNIGYKLVTYTALLTQDGVNVTDTHDPSEFRWYLEKTEGQQEISGSPARSVRLNTKDYFYGQAIMLEWTYIYTDPISEETKTAQLRSRVTLISNDAITQVAKYTTEVTSGGVFVHRADGNYDVGADWQSVWAYGVKISNTVDIIKGGQIYGSFGGTYLTIGHTSYKNIYISNDTFIQFRDGSTVLTDIRPGSITLGRTASSYYNAYMDTQSLNFRQGTTILGKITANDITLGRTSTYNTYITTSGINFRYGTTVYGQVTSSTITLGNTSDYNTYITSSGVNFRYGSTTYGQVTASSILLGKYASGVYNTYIDSGGISLRLYSSILAKFTSSGLDVYNSSGTSIASFGSTARIGASNSKNVIVNSNGLNLYNNGTLLGYLGYTTSYYSPHTYNTYTNALFINTPTFFAINVANKNIPQFTIEPSPDVGGYYDFYFCPNQNAYGIFDDTGVVCFEIGYDGSRSGNKSVNFATYSQNSYIYFGIGSGGTNRGIYDYNIGKWIIYAGNLTSTSQKVKTGLGGFDTGSDRKRKNIVGEINYAKDFVMSLQPIQYIWKDDEEEKINLGFVAQEVNELNKKFNINFNIASAIYAGETDKVYHGEDVDDKELEWFLDYNELIAPLVQVVQDQEKIIDDLERRLSQLE